MSTIKRKLLTAAILIALFATFLGPCSSNASADWTGPQLSYSPSTAWVGDRVNAAFTLTSTDSNTVGLSSCTLRIDWGATTTTVDSMTGTMALTPRGQTTLRCSFVVPQVADGSYNMVLTITGKAAGDWLSTTYRYTCQLKVTNTTRTTGRSAMARPRR